MAAVNAAAAGIVDPTKTGKYPVILSDALLGKSAKEIYTGVRYNHKPALSSDTTTPASARLKPSPSQNGAFDLSFADENGGRYAYTGSRSSTPDSSSGSSPFVLIFDPARQAFVLHHVDSVFNMNLTKTPTNSDADALREEFPHLNSSIKVQVGGGSGNAGKNTSAAGSSAPAAKSKSAGEKSGMKALAKLKERESKAKKTADKERKEPPAPISVPEATAKAEKAAKRRDKSQVDSDEDEEDDDDDGGLLIEYPEGEAPTASRFNQTTDFSPAFPVIPRRFSEFVRDGGDDDQDDDADGEEEFDMPEVPEDDEDEEEDEPMSTFKLPSPVGQQNQQQAAADDDEDIEDLEAALEKEFAMDSESSVSEED